MVLWPKEYVGAVSLTFDDGMDSQLSIAAPLLDQHELRGTFYLNPRGAEESTRRSPGWRERLERWRPVAEAGHEIGNHTIQHPCSLNIDIKRHWNQRNLLDWSLDELEADMLEAQRRIAAVFPTQAATSFAYPCYETSVGRGATRTSYVPLVARHFVAGRVRGELANDPHACDLHHLSSWPAERMTGAAMVGLVEQAVAERHWGIFTFHGIHEGHLPVAESDLHELLDHLTTHRSRIWTAPVAEVAAYVGRRA